MTKRKYGTFQGLVAVLLILVAVLMVYSRSQRAARRVHIPGTTASQQAPGTAASQQVPGGGEPVQVPGFEALQQGLDSTGESRMNDDMGKTASINLPEPMPGVLLGKVVPERDSLFMAVDERFATRTGMFMHREAYRSFVAMHRAAGDEGVNLVIVSAMRTFDHQKRIWENKWNGRQILHGNISATSIADPADRAREILRFSAMPGTSRHHWGTDIDLNSLQNDYFDSGEGKKVYDWLLQNASAFGFCQPYTAFGSARQGGYEEEKWHWSYKPLSAGYLQAYKRLVSYDDIGGFDGWETARQIGVIENYVLEVDPLCCISIQD
ncbi:MAG: M15 family metallopeptidase [Bacteroidales bacterium]